MFLETILDPVTLIFFVCFDIYGLYVQCDLINNKLLVTIGKIIYFMLYESYMEQKNV